MKIQKDSVVTINYTLTDDAGVVLDCSSEHGPLSFIHGSGQIIPGLESALEGRGKGEEFTTTILPEMAYGPRREELVHVVSRGQFEGSGTVDVGMQFEADTDQGPMLFHVVSVDDQSVTVDGNHPLSGQTLKFDVTILEIREATKEEMEHGHVHGEGGHHH